MYPREETRRSLNRLIRAMDAEYQLLCKRKAQEKKAQELKEEGFSATPVTESPSCENKESLENVTAPSDDLIEENLSEDAAAKELSTSEAGDTDAEELRDRQQAAQEETGIREEESEASDASKDDDPESLAVVEEEDLVPAGSDEEEEDRDVDEDDEPKGYSSATIDGQTEAVQGVMMKEKPERFTRHEGKQVLLPAGALGGQTEQVLIEVANVYAVVRAKEAEVKKHQAECVWVYDIRRTEDGKGRLVSCVDMLQFLVPKGLLTQEKKMATALSNARGMNFALGNRLMKHDSSEELDSWWYEKG